MKKRIISFVLVMAIILSFVPQEKFKVSANITPLVAGNANDGVDFASLMAGNIYMGKYQHAISLHNSTYGEATKEESKTPVLWKVMGEEQSYDNLNAGANTTGDGYLTLMSRYVLDSAVYSKGTVYAAPYVASHPADISVTAGSNAAFSVVYAGVAPTYQWQLDSGSGFADIASATAATYTATAVTAGQNGYKYRCVLKKTGQPDAISDAATLSVVASAPVVRTNPNSIGKAVGQSAVFTVLQGGGVVSFQWKVSTDGGASFTPISGATAATYVIPYVSSSDNGKLFQCAITSSLGTATSSNAALNILTSNPQPVFAISNIRDFLNNNFNDTNTFNGAEYSSIPTINVVNRYINTSNRTERIVTDYSGFYWPNVVAQKLYLPMMLNMTNLSNKISWGASESLVKDVVGTAGITSDVKNSIDYTSSFALGKLKGATTQSVNYYSKTILGSGLTQVYMLNGGTNLTTPTFSTQNVQSTTGSLAGVRPIYKLDPARIVMADEITVEENGYMVGTEEGDNYKLTLVQDETGTLELSNLKRNGYVLNCNDTISLPYNEELNLTGIVSSENNSINYKIVDNTGKIVNSGIAAELGNTNKQISIPIFSLSGNYKLYLWEQKNYSNQSNIASFPVLLNLTVNQSNFNLSGIENFGIYNENKTVTFNEGTATLNGEQFISGTEINIEGTYTLIGTDNAGITKTYYFKIDKTAPVITIGEYYTAPTNQDITVEASTNEGKINATSYTFSSNGSFEFIALDSAGNQTSQTLTINNICKEVPEILLSTNVEFDNFSTITATINYKQRQCGIQKWCIGIQDVIYFREEGKEFIKENGVYINTINAKENGIYTIYARDDLGNEAVQTINIDSLSVKAPLTTTFGGNSFDYIKSLKPIINTSGDINGYIAVGYSNSTDADMAGFNNKGALNWWEEDYDAFIIYYNSSMQIINKRIFAGESDDYFNDIIIKADGNFLIVGMSYSNSGFMTTINGEGNGIILNINSNGDVISGKKTNYVCESVKKTSEYCFAVCGDNYIEEYYNNLTLKWSKFISSAKIFNITYDENGYLFAAGNVNPEVSALNFKGGDSDAYIAKLNEEGIILWESNFGGTSFESYKSIDTTTDGGCIVAGYSGSWTNDMSELYKGSNTAILVKYSSDGEIEWKSGFGGSKYERYECVKQTEDGGYITVGASASNDGDVTSLHYESGESYPVNDALIVKYDSNGTVVWKENYGGTSYDEFYSVVEIEVGNYFAVGYSKSSDYNLNGIYNMNTEGIIARYGVEDNTAPYCEFIDNAESYFTNQNIEVIVKPEDINGSGIRECFVYIEKDFHESLAEYYTETKHIGYDGIKVLFNTEGRHRIRVKLIDNWGNSSEFYSFYFNIDKTAPVVEFDNYYNWTDSRTVEFKIFDNCDALDNTLTWKAFISSNNGNSWNIPGGSGSGQNGYYWVDGGVELPTSDGIYMVKVEVRDSTGNKATYISDSALRDRERPKGSFLLANYSMIDSEHITGVTFLPSDNLGVLSWSYRIGKQSGYSIDWGNTVTNYTSQSGVIPLPEEDGTYIIEATVVDIAGNCSNAITRTYIIDRVAPTTPSDLRTINITQNSVTLTWNASSDNIELEYKIYKSDGTHLATTSNTTYTIYNLSPQTNYSYYVVAVCKYGHRSVASNVINVTTYNKVSEPRMLRIASITQNSISIAWIAPSTHNGNVTYLVYRDGNKIGETNQTSYPDSGLAAGSWHWYCVVAVSRGFSPQSNSCSGTVLTNHASGLVSGEIYYLRNVLSDKYLDVFNHQTANYSPVYQWDYTGTPNQQWKLQRLANGNYKLLSVNAFGTDKEGTCLDVLHTYQFNQNFAEIGIYKDTPNNSSEWAISNVGGQYVLQSAASSKTKVLTAPGFDSAPVFQYSYAGGPGSQWVFENVQEIVLNFDKDSETLREVYDISWAYWPGFDAYISDADKNLIKEYANKYIRDYNSVWRTKTYDIRKKYVEGPVSNRLIFFQVADYKMLNLGMCNQYIIPNPNYSFDQLRYELALGYKKYATEYYFNTTNVYPDYEVEILIGWVYSKKGLEFSTEYIRTYYFNFNKYFNSTYSIVDALQTILDIGGLVPVIGEPLDGINGTIYFIRGDYLNAALSMGSVIPIGGYACNTFKFVRKGLSYADEAKAIKEVAEGLVKYAGKSADEIISIGKRIVPSKGFSSWNAMSSYLGSAGDGRAWHHIVEQCQIKTTRSGFASVDVNNIDNIINMQNGSGTIHNAISSFYSSIPQSGYTQGLTVRNWLSTQSFDEQFKFGIKELKKYGDVIPTSNGWEFAPF